LEEDIDADVDSNGRIKLEWNMKNVTSKDTNGVIGLML
jgi:hypothetical protein